MEQKHGKYLCGVSTAFYIVLWKLLLLKHLWVCGDDEKL